LCSDDLNDQVKGIITSAGYTTSLQAARSSSLRSK